MTSVFIAGAGPTGLSAAIALKARGFDVRIIDLSEIWVKSDSD